MAKKNLYRAVVKDMQQEKKERTLYVATDSIVKAANMLVEELSVDEELKDISCISEECYV